MTLLPLRTPRLVLIPASTEVLEAELSSAAALGIGFDGPGSDPHEPTAIRFVLPAIATTPNGKLMVRTVGDGRYRALARHPRRLDTSRT